MTDAGPGAQPGSEQSESEQPESDWQRRRRLAEVFGDVLPDTTRDERDPAEGAARDGGSAGDRWLREQVPPHHG